MEIDTEKLKGLVLGMDLRIAKNNLRLLYPDVKPVIEYRESDRAKFSIIGFKYNRVTGLFTFIVASDCPIYNLPMLYHENEFLKRFMMIFQVFFNQSEYLLRNIDMYFKPSESPKEFLPTLISWLGLNLKLLQGDEKLIRKVLQYAIPLFKIRGTAKGLKLFLYLISGIMPEIIESDSSSKNLSISKEIDVDLAMFTESDISNVFYVYFPCLESELSRVVVEAIHNVVQSEKPSYTQGFVVFKKPVAKRRNVTTYEETDMSFMAEETEQVAESAETSRHSGAQKRKRKHPESKKSGTQTSETMDGKPEKKTDFDDSIIDF